jgi:hypothetical protein
MRRCTAFLWLHIFLLQTIAGCCTSLCPSPVLLPPTGELRDLSPLGTLGNLTSLHVHDLPRQGDEQHLTGLLRRLVGLRELQLSCSGILLAEAAVAACSNCLQALSLTLDGSRYWTPDGDSPGRLLQVRVALAVRHLTRPGSGSCSSIAPTAAEAPVPVAPVTASARTATLAMDKLQCLGFCLVW